MVISHNNETDMESFTMNKLNTLKLTGIATLALASVGLTASAVAGPGDNPNKGPKSSIKVQAICSLDNISADEANLNLRTLITDKTSEGGPAATVLSTSTQAYQGVGDNRGKMKFKLLGEAVEGPNSMSPTDPVGNEFTTTINVCAVPSYMLSADANALNAEVTVEILDGHKTFYAKCGDDPMTDIVEGGIKIGHLALCQ